MTFYPGIPASVNKPSSSQSQIQTNFATLSATFGVDHVTYGAGASQGQHTAIHFNSNSSPSTPTTPVAILYTALANSISQLFYLESAGDTSQLTLQPSLAQLGFTILPGRILIRWGTFTSNAGISSYTYPVVANIPVFTAVYGTITQPIYSSGSPNYFCYVSATTSTTSFAYDSVQRTSQTALSGNFFYASIGSY